MKEWLALLSLAVVGCGGSPGSGSCSGVGGSWTIAAHCEPSFVGQTVTITQSGCSLSVGAPFSGFSGSIDGSGGVAVSGSAGGTNISCTGSLSGTTITMSCQPTCAVTLQKQ